MKKIIYLIILTFLLTGCSATVDLKITSDTIYENFKIYDLKSNVYNYDGSLKEDISEKLRYFNHDFSHYDVIDYEDGAYVGKNYSFYIDYDSWKEFSRLRTCYDYVNITKKDKNIYINTSPEYRCGYIFGGDNVTLNISSDLIISDSNADQVINNIHTWYINNDNYENRVISINLESNKETEREQIERIEKENIEKNSKKNEYIIYGIIGLVIIVVLFLIIKIKNSNK